MYIAGIKPLLKFWSKALALILDLKKNSDRNKNSVTSDIVKECYSNVSLDIGRKLSQK